MASLASAALMLAFDTLVQADAHALVSTHASARQQTRQPPKANTHGNTHVNAHVDTHNGRVNELACIDVCIDICMDTCIDMCADIWIGMHQKSVAWIDSYRFSAAPWHISYGILAMAY